MRYFWTITFLMMSSGSTLAHHAMEYIALESYSTTRAGERVFHLHYDYMVEDDANPSLDHWEFTPGVSYGVTNRLMLDAHTHLAKFGAGHLNQPVLALYSPGGPSPFMEAVAFSAQYRITDGFPIELAALATFEYPFEKSRDLLDGKQVIETSLVASANLFQHTNLTLNLGGGMEEEERFAHWGLGIKTPLTNDEHGFQGGVELLGDSEGNWTLLPGVYFPLSSSRTIFKSGIEFGLNSSSLHLNTTLMVMF